METKGIEGITTIIYDCIDNEILKLGKKYDTAFDKKDTNTLAELISISCSLLDKYNDILACMKIYYDIGTGYGELRKLENKEEYLEKEIFNLRKCANLYYETNILHSLSDRQDLVAKHIAVQAYVNLGNALGKTGRHLKAIDNYFDALNIDDTFSMAYINLSIALFDFSRVQFNDMYSNYLNHAGYFYFLKAMEYKNNIHRQEAIGDVGDYISTFSEEYLENFLKQDINPPTLEMESEDELEYRSSINLYRLFLNPIEDVLPNHCFWVDDVQLPMIEQGTVNKELVELCELFTQIKSEYIYGRFLWFQAETTESGDLALCEKHTGLLYWEKLKPDFSYRDFMAKTAYKTLYSIFDKIGFFINKYWKLNISDNRVDFSKSIMKKVGQSYIFNPDLAHNDSLKSLFWIQKDLRSEERVFSTNPKAIQLASLRNSMEHRAYRTLNEKSNFDYKFTECSFREELELNTVDLLKILKEAIIYLALAVNEENQKRTLS